MHDAGFSRPAFDTIVASGPNSALPHARPTDRSLEAGEPTVLDFGGVYDGYCVDLTRTVQLGAAGEDLRRLYDAVELAQAAAIAAVRPGARPSAIDAAAREVLERHGLGEAFGHGTGHGLGLEVHEDPRVSRSVPGLPDDPVEPGHGVHDRTGRLRSRSGRRAHRRRCPRDAGRMRGPDGRPETCRYQG